MKSSGAENQAFWEGFWRLVGFGILLAAGVFCAKEARQGARAGHFEFRLLRQDRKAGNVRSFEGVEARRVAAGLYGVTVLCGLWGLRLVGPRPWFLGRFRKTYLRLSLAALAACMVVLFPPWRLFSSWPILTFYFLPAAAMVVSAATHHVPKDRRQELRGKIMVCCFMAAVLLCAIGQGYAFATGALGLVTSLILYAHVEKLAA